MNNIIDNNLSTERLVLRRFSESDFENYYDILKQEEVSSWLGDRKGISEETVKKIIAYSNRDFNKNSYCVWAVVDRENNKLLGHCGLNPLKDIQETELFYAFDPKAWGNGYATEAAREVIKFACHELKLKRLVAIAYPDNNRSCRVIEKLGFIYKGEQEHFGGSLSYYELELGI